MGVLILSVCLSYVVANYLGSKRRIGFGWSLFFCLTLTIIGGLIVTLLSRKDYSDAKPPSRAKIVIGWILIIFYSLSILGICIELMGGASPERIEIRVKMLSLAVGFVGLGIYLIKLGKSNDFNTKALTNTVE